MSTSMIVTIAFFAVAMILILIALAWAMLGTRKQRRHDEAEKIRHQAKEEAPRVRQREALAAETAAKSRAAQVEADVKAAQAAGLEPPATRAEALDPATPATTETEPSADRQEPKTGTVPTSHPYRN